ncbi:GPRMGL5, partial [Cordylochernes scorpioides]
MQLKVADVQLYDKVGVAGVIVFGSDQEVAGVMRAVRRNNATGRFSWIGSDGWSARTLVFAGHEAQVEGTLSLQPRAQPVPGFLEHFRRLHPDSNLRNPWFPEYWERYFGCRWAGYPATPYNARLTRPCTGLETYGPEFEMERQLQFVADAVMAFAHALHAMHVDRCGGVSGLCNAMSPVHGPTLLQYLKNVSFRGFYDDEDFRFSSSGDGPVRYNILHFKQTRPNFYEWIQVGEFRDGRLALDLRKVQFRPGQPQLPESRCSTPCGPGQAKQVLSEAEACCWRCVACGRYQVLQAGVRCEDCGLGTLPDVTHAFCLPLSPYHMRPDSPWALGAMVFATLGICITLAVILVFWRYNDTPVVRASGRELSYVLLGGILICYGCTFLLVQKPTDMVCGVQKCTLGLGFSVIYAALWTKTNRIARIFRAGARRRPGFISPKSQLFICGSLVSVQLSVTAVWLAYVPPRAVRKFPSREMAVLVCSESLDGSSYAVAFAYPGVLIAICTAYAVLTRNTPEAFNESKYIGFSMYTTCVIWLAFVPIYVTTARQAVLNLTAMAVAISLSASVTLACLFVPKVYVILARPDRNVRKALVLQTKTYTPSPANLTTVSVPLEPSTQSESKSSFLISFIYTNQTSLLSLLRRKKKYYKKFQLFFD